MNRNRATALIGAASFAAGTLFAPVAAWAQQKRPLNVAERHPTATGVAAGVATRQALKASARNKKRQGRRLNFAERHPTLSGIGAGLTTRHVLKRSAAKKGH